MARILDLGCGDGFFSFVLSKRKNNKVIGIDLSKESIKIAKKRYPNIEFKVMDIEKTTFTKAYFDEVYAMDVLEHVDHLNDALNEVERIIKKRGRLIINVPHPKSEKWLLKIRPSYFKEIHHVRIFKEKELDSMITKMGFNLVLKKRMGFLQHLELYFLFKRRINSDKQTSIGSWRDSYLTKTIHAAMLYFDPMVLKTPLAFFPIWFITLPLGSAINFLGDKVLPKSIYYEFIKKG